MLTAGALSEIYPDTQLYTLPFLFHSYEELDYVRARMDKTIAQGIEAHNFVSFGFSDGGFAYLMSNTPIRRIEDLKGQKIWVPEGDDISRAMFETLGVSAIPLPLTDVLTGLQTGLITTLGSSLGGAIALQWHTKVKYVVDAPVIYLYGLLALEKKIYTRMSVPDQTVVREVMERVFAGLNRQNRLDDLKAREALRRQGIEFLPLPPEELARLRTAADQTIEGLGKKGVYTPTQLKTLRAHLETYRRQPAASRKP